MGNFPVEVGPVAVHLVACDWDGQARLIGTMQMILFEDGQVTDIREQSVRMIEAPRMYDPRLSAAVEGWRSAVIEAVRSGGRADPWRLMLPCDLWMVPELLHLKRPHTVMDFEHALLSVRSRLGRFLND